MMDLARRERIRELIQMLKPIEEELQDILSDEEGLIEESSATSQETESDASHVIECLEDAVDELTCAVGHLLEAIGDDAP
jgi:hypothetical protein